MGAPILKPEFPPLLDRGFHHMTIEDVRALCVAKFPTSTRRRQLMDSLEETGGKRRAKCVVLAVPILPSSLSTCHPAVRAPHSSPLTPHSSLLFHPLPLPPAGRLNSTGIDQKPHGAVVSGVQDGRTSARVGLRYSLSLIVTVAAADHDPLGLAPLAEAGRVALVP